MLQDLIKAYADAYTIAITPAIAHRHEDGLRNRESSPEAAAKVTRGRGWRVLLSALL